jgi:hypothetical protein
MWCGSGREEDQLRGILSQALTLPQWLHDVLDASINFNEAYRFGVDQEIWQQRFQVEPAGTANPDECAIVRRLTDVARIELSEELSARKVPQRQGYLVVVTSPQSLRSLEKAGVWRGLTDGLPSEDVSHNRLGFLQRFWRAD